MKLYLARHGEAFHNLEQRLNAEAAGDRGLTAEGRRQAAALAATLSNVPLEAIYVSELPRCRQTAEIVNRYHDLPLISDARLNENRSGYEGRPLAEYLTAFERSRDPWQEAFYDGESLAAARQRAADFLASLRSGEQQTVLAVSHGYIIESLYGLLHGLDFEAAVAFQLAPAEFAVLDV